MADPPISVLTVAKDRRGSGLPEASVENMRVDHRGFDVLVTHQLLDRANVMARF